MSEFPRITKQAKGIAGMYKWLGLFSIPVLTLVTIISISNVFTRGQLASGSGFQTLWAVLFAIAIEVNIVRLFFEAKLDDDTGAKVVGIGLVIVAGTALLIEGLQQSIGFSWNNLYIQFAIGLVVFLRVILVVVLMAREGSKLATSLVASNVVMYACVVSFPEPPTVIELLQTVNIPVAPIVNDSNVVPFTPANNGDKAKRVQKALRLHPDFSNSEIAKKAGVSPSYVSQIKGKTGSMPDVKVEKVGSTNGHVK